jgi:phage baseplate assembly protein W
VNGEPGHLDITMPSYSFKHVGKTKTDSLLETAIASTEYIGIKTPLQLGTNAGILEMHTSLEAQLSDNLRNLIMTNWGERVGLYDFGANLRPLMTENNSNIDFDTEAGARIKNAVERWMPFVDLDSWAVETEEPTSLRGIAIKKLTVVYNIPALDISNKALQVFLYAI